MKHLFLLLFLCHGAISYSVDSILSKDELRVALREQADSTHSGFYYALAFKFYPEQLDSAIYYMSKATIGAKKMGYKVKEAEYERIVGVFYYMASEYDLAIDHYVKAIVHFSAMEDTLSDFAEVYRDLGMCYYEQGEYVQSIEFYYSSLGLFERLHDTLGQGRALTSIGSSQEKLGNIPEAISLYRKSLLLKEMINDASGISVGLMNLGNIYFGTNNLDSALHYHNAAYRKAVLVGGTREIIDALTCLSGTHKELGDLRKAERYTLQALSYFQEYDNAFQLAGLYNRIAGIYIDLELYNRAIEYLTINRDLSEYDGLKGELKEDYRLYSLAYDGLQDYEKAFHFYKLYRNLSDTLINIESDKLVEEARQKYESEKNRLRMAGQLHQGELDRLKGNTQSLLTRIFAIGLIVSVTILFFLFRLIRSTKKTNELLGDSLREKEVLIKEVHHRVKNNFQLISSLLNLQSHTIDDVKAKESFELARNRIRSMALVHQNLYLSETLTNVDIQEYLEELIHSIVSAFVVPSDHIVFDSYAEDIFFDIDTAIPLGLIINELVTNSLKYAFSESDAGHVVIRIIETKSKTYVLTYQDNGVGLPVDFDPGKTGTLGMELVDVLVNQIDGRLDCSSNGGARFEIRFKG